MAAVGFTPNLTLWPQEKARAVGADGCRAVRTLYASPLLRTADYVRRVLSVLGVVDGDKDVSVKRQRGGGIASVTVSAAPAAASPDVKPAGSPDVKSVVLKPANLDKTITISVTEWSHGELICLGCVCVCLQVIHMQGGKYYLCLQRKGICRLLVTSRYQDQGWHDPHSLPER